MPSPRWVVGSQLLRAWHLTARNCSRQVQAGIGLANAEHFVNVKEGGSQTAN
jgi:hypothetical protein